MQDFGCFNKPVLNTFLELTPRRQTKENFENFCADLKVFLSNVYDISAK